MPQTYQVAGVSVPSIIYGTAWKEERTQHLTALAIAQGFRAMDTANQRRHYVEADVGAALRRTFDEGTLSRDDVFLQTKFTFQRGQDHRLPYEPHAAISTQVKQSLSSSLVHLGVDIIDSYLLHGPTLRQGLTADDWAAWHAMEELHESGQVRLIGISNVSIDQLDELCQKARIKPAFVQNRCYANKGWDRAVRAFCAAHAIQYQGFSLLTANVGALNRLALAGIAERHALTIPQVVFAFAHAVGMIALTGTTNADHMREDLRAVDVNLDDDEVYQIEHILDEQG